MSEKSWKYLGIISTVLLVIISTFQIIDWVDNKKSKVKARIFTSKYHIPLGLDKKYSPFKMFEIQNQINDILEETINNKEYKQVADSISQLLISNFQSSFLSNASSYSLVEINLISNSSKIIKGLNIEMDASGLCQVIDQEGKEKILKFDHLIPLDNLRPNNSIKVFIWTTNLYWREKTKINFDGGYVIPTEEKRISGFFLFLNDWWSSLLFIIPLLFSISWLIFVFIRQYIGSQKGPKQLSTKPDVPLKKGKGKKKGKKKLSQ